LAQGAAREKLSALLVTIADWIMQSGVGSNQLNNATYWDPPDAIFVNGNLARVLLAAGKITGRVEYGAEGLQWCDAFVTVQQQIATSTGLPGGYWDTGYAVPVAHICRTLDPAIGPIGDGPRHTPPFVWGADVLTNIRTHPGP
jgi:hypothetical protein